MFNFKEYVPVKDLKEAYELLCEDKKNLILGGCNYLLLTKKRFNKGIDLSKLNLNYIKEENNFIKIGAMATFRDLETNEIIKNFSNGFISKAVSEVMGVAFRNSATVGASVFSKYGFSDLLTPLLAANAKVHLFNKGIITLKEFLKNKKIERDILIEVLIPKTNEKAVFLSVRKAIPDYSIINLSLKKYRAENNEVNFILSIGARPKRAIVAENFSSLLSDLYLQHLSGKNISEIISDRVLNLLVSEVTFQSNMRASKEYREALVKSLAKKAITEVF